MFRLLQTPKLCRVRIVTTLFLTIDSFLYYIEMVHVVGHLNILVIASCCLYFYHDLVCALQECFCSQISCSTTELCIAQYMYYYYEGSEIRTQRSIDSIATVYSRSRVLLLHHLVSSVRKKHQISSHYGFALSYN